MHPAGTQTSRAQLRVALPPTPAGMLHTPRVRAKRLQSCNFVLRGRARIQLRPQAADAWRSRRCHQCRTAGPARRRHHGTAMSTDSLPPLRRSSSLTHLGDASNVQVVGGVDALRPVGSQHRSRALRALLHHACRGAGLASLAAARRTSVAGLRLCADVDT
eukprot:3506289-Prymnesium_polylepis.2